MSRLYFIRHGQTDYNLQGTIQGGGIDSDLNDTGRMQGRLFYEKYRHLDFDGVYCSELKRTYQTVCHFESEGHQVKTISDLNEMNWGVLEGLAAVHAQPEYERMNRLWSSGGIEHGIAGGESPSEVWARVGRGIEQIVAEIGPGGNALVCAHGRLLRIILAEMLGYGIPEMNRFHHENTGLSLLARQPNGRWIAEKINDLSHLE